MTTEEDFQRQLDLHPDDHQTRLVFADWLEATPGLGDRFHFGRDVGRRRGIPLLVRVPEGD
jgi:hypothetical protein